MLMLRFGVAVGFFWDYGRLLEIIGGRRRRRFPLKTLRAPGICSRYGPIADGPEQIDEWNQVSHPEDRGAGGRHHVEHLKLGGLNGITPRHSQIAEHVLREKSEIEADENHQRGKPRPAVV